MIPISTTVAKDLMVVIVFMLLGQKEYDLNKWDA